ncbi:P-loop NTPase fold protein [Tumidithrix elongata RA019]|uniref:P-loop NTPase fold protein n=1 Tax=Tumidithrix elongata BACA0141 TaxID=2716417 RepID=A0AAW9Q1G7_9CYAN|nr:P-loop NTPase fold protein [Tumidithrix elongata RA019]
MDLELSRFLKACNPTHPLDSSNELDRSYYVDLSTVRGVKLMESLARTIARMAPDEATCQLFTGHIGCGKSTELLRLKYELDKQKFHVAYFECDKQLELSDVDASDVLLAIAGQISATLEGQSINIVPAYFKKLFGEMADLLQTKLDLGVNFKLSVGIAEITAQAKNSPSLRRQMRERLESRTNSIINSINKELLAPAKKQLREKGMKGLVVIVDNLDRIENRIDPKEQSRAGYLFVERGDQLRGLDCHLVYTVPLLLTFSNDAAIVTGRFGTEIKTLPMIPARLADGSECEEGMALLRQIVMARAFPTLSPLQRIEDVHVKAVFDSPQTLDRLCQVSGGHVRNLFRFLLGCLQQDDPPISASLLESIIANERNKMSKIVTDDEWELIRKVHQDKRLSGEAQYQMLIKSQFVFEYEYQGNGWFDCNPILDKLL